MRDVSTTLDMTETPKKYWEENPAAKPPDSLPYNQNANTSCRPKRSEAETSHFTFR